MKKPILFVVALLCFFLSCTSPDEPETNNLTFTDIKVFKNADEFKSTLDLFSSFKSNADFENWSARQNFKSLQHSDSFVDEDEIPFKFLFILNKNKEFIIGNKMISFSDGAFYESPLDASGNVGKEKKIFARVSISKIPMNGNNTENTALNRVNINANGGDFKEGWQEFNRVSYAVGCATPTPKSLKYRLVHYLVVEKLSGPNAIQTDLIFKLRMSQYLNGSWVYNNTSTERLYSFNISGDYIVNGPFVTGTGTFSESDSNSCGNPLKGTKAYWLANYNFPAGTNLSLYHWDVALSGNVYHQVNGDVNSVNTYVSW